MLILTRPNARTVLLEFIDQSEWQHKTNIHHTDRRNTIQCITTISPMQPITILAHLQIKTMWSLGRIGAMRIFHLRTMLALCLMLFSAYYAHNYAGIIGTGILRIFLETPSLSS